MTRSSLVAYDVTGTASINRQTPPEATSPGNTLYVWPGKRNGIGHGLVWVSASAHSFCIKGFKLHHATPHLLQLCDAMTSSDGCCLRLGIYKTHS